MKNSNLYIRSLVYFLVLNISFFKINSFANSNSCRQLFIPISPIIQLNHDQDSFHHFDNYKLIINELVEIYTSNLQSKKNSNSNTNWKPVITESLIQDKKNELETKFGKSITREIFKDVKQRVMQVLNKNNENDIQPNNINSISSENKQNQTVHVPQFLFEVVHEKMNKNIVVSQSRKLMITTDNTDTAKVWDVANGKLLFHFEQDGLSSELISISNDDLYILIGSKNTTEVKVLDAKNGTFIFDLKGHTQPLRNVEFSLNNQFILTESIKDYRAILWDRKTGTQIKTFFNTFGSHFSTDSQFITYKSFMLMSDGHKQVKYNSYEINTGIKNDDSENNDVYSNNKQLFIPNPTNSQSFADGIKVFDSLTGELKFTLSAIKKKNHENYKIIFSHNDQYIITHSVDIPVQLWSAKTGELIFTFENNVVSMNFSPSDRFIIIGHQVSKEDKANDKDKNIITKLYDVKTGLLESEFKGYFQFITDDEHLIALRLNEKIQIWKTSQIFNMNE